LLFGVATFFVLRALKPPSFSYDRFFASTGELVVWALGAAAASWLLAMWGASFGMLIGVDGHVDPRIRYEWGIGRTRLRLNKRSARILILAGLLPPLALFWGGEVASSWDQVRRASAGAAGAALHVTPRQLLLVAAAVVVLLALVLRLVKIRADLAR